MQDSFIFQSDLVAPLTRREQVELSLQPNVHLVEEWAIRNNRVEHVKVQEKINTINRIVSFISKDLSFMFISFHNMNPFDHDFVRINYTDKSTEFYTNKNLDYFLP